MIIVTAISAIISIIFIVLLVIHLYHNIHNAFNGMGIVDNMCMALCVSICLWYYVTNIISLLYFITY
jgi:hypothetical protein